MRGCSLLVLFAACSYNPSVAGDDGTPASSDGQVDTTAAVPDPLHLAPEDGAPGTGALVADGTLTIDTSVPSISVTLPAGTSLDVRPQLSGPEVAVLHVGTLTITAGASVRVQGSRPLIIVAGGAVSIAGLLDGGARGTQPGPGGGAPGSGPSPGLVGAHGSSDSDTGGGGGGYGGAGANSGAITGCTVALGLGGGAFGDGAITRLVGGSGGAASSGTACDPDAGGAGGGALQITSLTLIEIVAGGAINVGGGGGEGSTDCGDVDVNSGAGGGSGGAVVLQAPTIRSAGIVAANGGGGGGSSQTSMGNAQNGEDATASLTPADGGTGPRATGGAGGAGALAPTLGGNAPCGGNSAGGGGAVGRIAVSSTWDTTGSFSPAPNATLPD